MINRKTIWTPVLVSLPILIIAFIGKLILLKWTPLYLLAIVAFIVNILLILCMDRVLAHFVSPKYVWIAETLFIVTIILVKLYSKLSWIDMIFLLY